MGYCKHHAILATTWDQSAVDRLIEFATTLGAEAVASCPQRNHYITVCVTPDGGKSGWMESDDGDIRRGRIKEWLRQNEDLGFEWVEVSYGADDEDPAITDSTEFSIEEQE